MTKAFLKAIVRNGGKGRQGVGVQMFRLDATEEVETDLTELETEEAADSEPSSTAIIRIYEELGQNFWDGSGISAKKFAEELDALGSIKRLNIHINCLGGDAFTAQAMYSIIGDHPAKSRAYIDGVAASAATIVACAADEVVARHNSSYMVHYPWAVAVGNADVMRKAAEDLDKLSVPIVNVYQKQVRDKLDEAAIRDLMANETWLTADEALEAGFVDRIKGKIRAIAKVSNTQILCSGQLMNFAKYQYKNLPAFPLKEMPQPKVRARIEVKSPQMEGNKPMTLEELEKEHPELLQSIRVSAAHAEGTRLAALDAMMAPGMEAIIVKAKAEGKQPSDIAQECYAVAQKSLLEISNVQKLKNDANPAAAVPAGDAPLVPPPGKIEKGKGVFNAAMQRKGLARPPVVQHHGVTDPGHQHTINNGGRN